MKANSFACVAAHGYAAVEKKAGRPEAGIDKTAIESDARDPRRQVGPSFADAGAPERKEEKWLSITGYPRVWTN